MNQSQLHTLEIWTLGREWYLSTCSTFPPFSVSEKYEQQKIGKKCTVRRDIIDPTFLPIFWERGLGVTVTLEDEVHPSSTSQHYDLSLIMDHATVWNCFSPIIIVRIINMIHIMWD